MMNNKKYKEYEKAITIFKEATFKENDKWFIDANILAEKIKKIENHDTKQILYYIIKKNNPLSDVGENINKIFAKKFWPFDEEDNENKFFIENIIPSYEDSEKNAFNWENIIQSTESYNPYWLQSESDNYIGYERPLGFKIRISALTLEEADKIWDIFKEFEKQHKDEFDFKVPKNKEKFYEIVGENAPQASKFITIYTHTDKQGIELAKELVEIFDKEKSFNPVVPIPDISIGNTGKISISIDRDEMGKYTSHIKEDTRFYRRDLYNMMKKKLEEEGLIYGLSKKLNEQINELIHFSNRFYDILPKELEEQFIETLKTGETKDIVSYFNNYNIDYNSIGEYLGQNFNILKKSGTFDYVTKLGVPRESLISTAYKKFKNEEFFEIFECNKNLNTIDLNTIIENFYGTKDFEEKFNRIFWLMASKYCLKEGKEKLEIKDLTDYLVFVKPEIKEKYEKILGFAKVEPREDLTILKNLDIKTIKEKNLEEVIQNGKLRDIIKNIQKEKMEELDN